MNNLARNMQSFYYANIVSVTDIVDSSNYKTGEKVITYSTPALAKGNIGTNANRSVIEMYGVDAPYMNRILCKKDYGIKEDSIIFIGVEPKQTNGMWNHTHIVKSVMPSLNEFVIDIRKI